MSVPNTQAEIIPSFVKSAKFKIARNQRIFDLRAQGLSYNEIARIVNLTPQRVGWFIKNYKKYYEGGQA